MGGAALQSPSGGVHTGGPRGEDGSGRRRRALGSRVARGPPDRRANPDGQTPLTCTVHRVQRNEATCTLALPPDRGRTP